MIKLQDLSLRRGTKVLLDEATVVINPGERVGIVGNNGAGKSTLFALLQGHTDHDAGQVSIPKGWQIAAVEQVIADEERRARDFVIDGDQRLRALQRQRAALTPTDSTPGNTALGTAPNTASNATSIDENAQVDAPSDNAQLTEAERGQRIAELEMALTDAGHWTVQSRAEQLLTGLGFAPSTWDKPVGEFSGGWRMRLALARALMQPSDLLLLDEPTNHLDLDAMVWLERWLSSYPGTVLIISHDTAFLNQVAQVIVHFNHHKLDRYTGNYDAFIQQQAVKLQQHEQAYQKQQAEIQHLQSFIDRFKAKATKAKQAQSRVKALERMVKLAPVHVASGIQFRLPDPQHMPDPLITLKEVSMGYTASETSASSPSNEHHQVLNNISLMIRGGARVGILGANGAGKSTFIKTLVGELAPLSGTIQYSKGVNLAYFAQHQLEMLDPQATPLLHLQRLAPDTRDLELRNYLGSFGFVGEQALAPVAPFSGGEKARLALALLVWTKPNILLLDEPSNHLDVVMREALSQALSQFQGSLLLVSHDRQLLQSTTDELWVVANGSISPFDGDLADYQRWLAEHLAAHKAEDAAKGAQNVANTTGQSATRSDNDDTAPMDRRTQRRLEAEQRQRLAVLKKPILKQLASVEKSLEGISQRLAELQEAMSQADFYDEANREQRIAQLNEHGQLDAQHTALEEQWLELTTQLEDIERQAED